MQSRYSYFDPHHYNYRIRIFILALSWIISILIGVYIASLHESANITLVQIAPHRHPTFSGIAVVVFIPLIISFLSAQLHCNAFIYILCSAKGITLGYCLLSVLRAFGSAGWLVGTPLFFSNTVTMVLLFQIWLSALSGSFLCSIKKITVYFAVAVCIVCIDYFMIAPYLIALMRLH